MKSSNKTAPNSLIVNENVITNNNYNAKIFSDCFVNVCSNLASQTPEVSRSFNTYIRKSVVNSFFINSDQESEIEKLLNILNQCESLGPFSIPVKILKNHVDISK